MPNTEGTAPEPHPLSRTLCNPEAGQPFSVNDVEYIMGGALGDGAAGLVRRAKRGSDGWTVAVKLLAPDPKYIDESVFDDVAARFKREGERGVRLRHPHLVEVIAYSDNNDGCAFETGEPKNPLLIMEYIRGSTLEGYIRKLEDDLRGHFSVDRERLNIACQLASAIEDLHSKRLVHRDVKPANIFLADSPGSVGIPYTRLGDFGVMKWGDFHASLSTGVLTTVEHKGLGTMKYMSPEAAIRPKDVSARSDVYSLGITLFELFTGQILASAHHVFEIMNARLSRGNTVSRYLEMGYRLNAGDEAIAELLLDMHLRGVSGRPSSEKVSGRLEWEYETRFERTWQEDLYGSA
jgi:eukaryotic-like serine/threonine-protein kinase